MILSILSQTAPPETPQELYWWVIGILVAAIGVLFWQNVGLQKRIQDLQEEHHTEIVQIVSKMFEASKGNETGLQNVTAAIKELSDSLQLADMVDKLLKRKGR